MEGSRFDKGDCKTTVKISPLNNGRAPLTVTGGHLHFLGGEADSIPELIKAVRLRKKRLRIYKNYCNRRSDDRTDTS